MPRRFSMGLLIALSSLCATAQASEEIIFCNSSSNECTIKFYSIFGSRKHNSGLRIRTSQVGKPYGQPVDYRGEFQLKVPAKGGLVAISNSDGAEPDENWGLLVIEDHNGIQELPNHGGCFYQYYYRGPQAKSEKSKNWLPGANWYLVPNPPSREPWDDSTLVKIDSKMLEFRDKAPASTAATSGAAKPVNTKSDK